MGRQTGIGAPPSEVGNENVDETSDERRRRWWWGFVIVLAVALLFQVPGVVDGKDAGCDDEADGL